MSDPVASPPGRYSPGRGRSAGFLLALLAEALLIILVLTFGTSIIQQNSAGSAVDVVRFRAVSTQEDKPAAEEPKVEESQKAEPKTEKVEKPVPQPTQAKPEEKRPPVPPVRRPTPLPRPNPVPSQPAAAASPAPPAAAPSSAAPAQQYGPPDTVGRGTDSPKVSGSGPNGEALYAASWYREPYKDELDGYLSTATGPGWGLIACRTAADFRVEDCIGIDEYPAGSNMNRAILAAAWQFKVRPPRVGGEPRIGEWVRIRIDYGTRRQ